MVRLLLVVLLGVGAAAPVCAQSADPQASAGAATQAPAAGASQDPAKRDTSKGALFINMTSGDAWRGWMGLHFADSTHQMGYPVTVFLNLDAVKLALKNSPQDRRSTMRRLPRDMLVDFISHGGVVLICGPCLQEFGIKTEDLVPGVQLGRPGLTQDYMFAPNTRLMTW